MSDATRGDALATLREGHGVIGELLDRLSPDAMVRPATIGGVDWSATDLVGHLETWEEIALAAISWWRTRAGALDDVLGADTAEEVNAVAVARKAGRPPGESRAAADATHARLLDEIDRLGNDEWSSTTPEAGEFGGTIAGVLGSVLGAPRHPFGHVFAHLNDLRAFVESEAAG